MGAAQLVRYPRRAALEERCPVHRATLTEQTTEGRRPECTNYVELARRMSIPADDAIRQFIETWVTKLRLPPTPGV